MKILTTWALKIIMKNRKKIYSNVLRKNRKNPEVSLVKYRTSKDPLLNKKKKK